MNLSRTSIAWAVMALTVSSAIPVYAQRGKPATPPRPVGKVSRPAKPSSSAAKPVKAPRPDIAARIASKPNLAAKLQGLLPAGMTLDEAAAGFRNQGQFIAAVHVSNNLGIPFVDLKTLMTGPEQKSLGQSIKQLRPAADAEEAASTAEQQATDDERVLNQ